MTSTPFLYRARLSRAIACAAVTVAAVALSGCATGPANDPFEKYNRGTTEFNESLDAI